MLNTTLTFEHSSLILCLLSSIIQFHLRKEYKNLAFDRNCIVMSAKLLLILAPILSSSNACAQIQSIDLPLDVIRATHSLCRVFNVSSTKGCLQLCLREKACGAIYHYESKCDLFTAHLYHFEGPAALTAINGNQKVWSIVARGFGECQDTYTAVWRSSRYRLSVQKVTWLEARQSCELEGAKLAELSSREEIEAVARQLGSSNAVDVFLGGFQMSGAKEPDGGWKWILSQLPVDVGAFSVGNPDNSWGEEHVLSASLARNSLLLNDANKNRRFFFICECVHLF